MVKPQIQYNSKATKSFADSPKRKRTVDGKGNELITYQKSGIKQGGSVMKTFYKTNAYPGLIPQTSQRKKSLNRTVNQNTVQSALSAANQAIGVVERKQSKTRN